MNLCDACETCSHCLKHGCIPVTIDYAAGVATPIEWPVIDETLIPESEETK